MKSADTVDHIEFWGGFLTTYLTTSTGGTRGDKMSDRSREHGFSDEKAPKRAEITRKTLPLWLGW